MNSKISFFNKGIFFSNLKRFSWAAILETIVIFLCFPFNIMMLTPRDSWFENNADILEWSIEYTILSNLSICVWAVVLSVLLFSYLHNPKMATALHGLAVSRCQLFLSTLLSGIVLLLAPIMINTILLVIIKSTMQIGRLVILSSVLRWALYALSLSLVLFAFSAFIGMFTGNFAAHFIFTYIIHFLPFAVFAGFIAMCSSFLFGFSESFDIPSWLLDFPMMTIFHDFTVSCNYYIFLYLALFVVLSFLALFIYKKRPLENAGDIVVFSWVKPIFKYGVSLCLSVAGFLYTAAISNIDAMNNGITSILIAVLWGGIGFCIAQMLVLKTWRIFSAYKELLTACLGVCIIFILFITDVTGFETRLVDKNDVASVTVSGFYEFPQSEITFTDADSIALVTDLHKSAIEKGSFIDNNKYSKFVRIDYSLKNGRKIKRSYEIQDSEILNRLYNHPETKRRGYMLLYDERDMIKSISIYHDAKTRYINDKDALLDALRYDVENAEISLWWENNAYPVEKRPTNEELSYGLEFELLASDMKNDKYLNGYRRHYHIDVSESKMPTAFALLSDILSSL